MSFNTEFKTIIEFNDYISNNNIDYDINVYFTKIHELFNNNVDISFMGYFLSLIKKKDEFCVEHTKLIEYGIIKERKDNTNIKRIIQNENFEFKENIDYTCLSLNVEGQIGRGGHNAKHYKMKPHVFKMCLMRSKNENKYAKYFLELEECFYYYKDYQIKYQKNIINGISKENRSLHSKIDKQSNDIKELLKFAKDTNEKLTDANDNIDNLTDEVNNLADEVKETTEKVEEVREEFKKQREHINPPPENDLSLIHI